VLPILPALCAACALLWGAVSASAEQAAGGVSVSLQPRLFRAELVTTEAQRLKEARLKSGLGLALDYGSVELDVDYQLQSLLKEEGALGEDSVSQLLKASLHSSALNKLLGLNAGIKANSVVKAGGNSYRYSVAPGFTKSLSQLADLAVNYQYILGKTSATAVEKEQRGYSVSLKGDLQQGRLVWSGAYRAASTVENNLALARSTEVIDFKSSFQVVPAMHLELSSVFKQEYLPGESGYDTYSEKRYAAAVAWSPSAEYALALRVNRLEDTRYNEPELFGSGTVTWFPQRNHERSLGYGDQLIEGDRGLMFNTILRLDPTL
jgi:hypothetical protein